MPPRNWPYSVRLWLRALFRRNLVERELDEELSFHLERQVAEDVSRGMDAEEARRRAWMELGGIERCKEECRDQRGLRGLERLRQDITYTFRGIRRSPGLTLAVILTIAIGVGAATSMYGVMERLFSSAPPGVAEPQRVFRIHFFYPRADRPDVASLHTSYPFFELLEDQADTLAAVSAYTGDEIAVGKGSEARRVHAGLVSAGFWRTMEIHPRVGRFMTDAEAHPATGSRVVVLGHSFWQSRFGGSPRVLGKTLQIKGKPYQIIGVTPRGFRGVDLEDVDLWLPLFARADGSEEEVDWHTYGSSSNLKVAVRLKPEVNPEQASAELTSLLRAFYVEEHTTHFGSADDPRLDVYRRVRALLGSISGGLGRDLQAIPEARVTRWLVGISFLLLAIACSNVAGLLLLRAMQRRREIAVRLALGVSRGRLALQFLTESSILAFLGGSAALILGGIGSAWLQRTILPALAWETDSLFDVKVLIVALLSTVAAALAAGLAPLLSVRSDLAAGLCDGDIRSSTRRPRLQRALLAGQGALSVVLLVGAGLFLRSLHNAESFDVGLERDATLALEIDFSGTGRSQAEVARFYERALPRVSTLPEVQSASLSLTLPLRAARGGSIRLPGDDRPLALSEGGVSWVNYVTPDFFKTTGMKLLAGRDFVAEERERGRVVVINETMAKTFWPGHSPIGECVEISGQKGCTAIIGVVADSRLFKIEEDGPNLYYYRPLPPSGEDSRNLLVRVAPGGQGVAGALRRALQELDPALPYVAIETLGEALDPEIRPWRLGASVFTAFGLLALVLAAIGLASAVGYSVSQKTREFGVRIALGARGRSLAALVLRDASRNAVLSLLAGLACAALAGPLLRDLLFEVSPRDPFVFAAVSLGMFLVSTISSLPPAWRAARIDPVVALRK